MGGNLPRSSSSAAAEIEVTDEFRIKELVYAYLLQMDFWSESPFSAIFLKGSDAELAALVRRFPNHTPRLKPMDRLRLYPARSPIDKETGKPAVLLAAVVSEPSKDGAEAIGTYYAGPMVSGKYVFKLKKVDDRWRIEDVRPPKG